MTLCPRPCFPLMEGPSLVQRFRYIVSLASLAYTFTILHAIQYSMQAQGQEPQDDDPQSMTEDYSTHRSASLSTHDTPATTSAAGTSEKTSNRWTDQEINLLITYVEGNCVLTTKRGSILKKSQFNKASGFISLKDAGQCQYKWGHVRIFYHQALRLLTILS